MTGLLSPFDLDQRLLDLAERRESAFSMLSEIQAGTFVAEAKAIEELKAELPKEIERMDAELRGYAALSRQGERAARLAQVDNLRDWMQHCKTMEAAATQQSKLMTARAKGFADRSAWIKSVIGEYMEAAGTRKLEGSHGTISLKANGGAEPLEIYDPSLVPDELQIMKVEMTFAHYIELRQTVWRHYDPSTGVVVDGPMPSNARIREALGKTCDACGGIGHARAENDNICPLCGGTGKASVPGARLLARQSHVEVR